MSKLLMALAAVVLAVGTASAQQPDWFEYDNQIGIFLTEHPTVENAGEMVYYDGPPGQFQVHVVLINPRNLLTDTPMANVGGFRLKLDLPVSLLVTETCPPGVTNALAYPDFSCTGSIPVIDDHCTLVTLTVGTFTMDPSVWYLAPLNDETDMTILDADDGAGESLAFPVTGDYSNAVFGMFILVMPPYRGIVSNESVSWSHVKSLYR